MQPLIQVYYSFIDPNMPEALFRQHLQQLPSSIQEDVLRYHQRADQLRVLMGKILLQKALAGAGFSPGLISELQYSEYKRPFIAGAMDFNITHSGNCVALAAGSNMKVGIDVEAVHPIKPEDILAVLRDEELHDMQQDNATPETILRFWTRKEAIVKASGEGLFMQPQSIYFTDELTAAAQGKTWHLHELDMGAPYIAYCATNLPNAAVQIEQV
ncbi:MAG TPA: 4'-phosphopantetheinyl transferase superfamily protein [Chitinophagaceae bacterium]|nr:4'-phosphopantetheinyl transferase superfamily protein [Chitinophagaceae bacterium]